MVLAALLASSSAPAAAQATGQDNLYGTYSPDGRLIAFESRRDGNGEIYVVAADGTGLRRLTKLPGRETTPFFSPDGRRVVFSSEVQDAQGGSHSDILVVDIDGGVPTVVVDWPSNEGRPSWSPDGSRLAFHTDRSGNRDIVVVELASGSISQVTSDAAHDDWPHWVEPTSLVFESERVAGWGIFTAQVSGTEPVQLPLRSEVPFTDVGAPAPSPDGAYLAFHGSLDGGGMKLWLVSLGSGEVRQVSHGEWDGLPAWAPDSGSLLFTRQSDGEFDLYVLDLQTGATRLLLGSGT